MSPRRPNASALLQYVRTPPHFRVGWCMPVAYIKGRPPSPVVIVHHNYAGLKQFDVDQAAFLARCGFVGVAVDTYREVGLVGHPDPARECKELDVAVRLELEPAPLTPSLGAPPGIASLMCKRTLPTRPSNPRPRSGPVGSLARALPAVALAPLQTGLKTATRSAISAATVRPSRARSPRRRRPGRSGTALHMTP